MIIILNGEETKIPENCTVEQLLILKNIPIEGTAVACNDKVVRRADHNKTQLCENDRIEVIRAVAGG